MKQTGTCPFQSSPNTVNPSNIACLWVISKLHEILTYLIFLRCKAKDIQISAGCLFWSLFLKAREKTELAEATCHYGESDSIPLGGLGDHVESGLLGEGISEECFHSSLPVLPHERKEESVSTLDKAPNNQETPWSFEGCSWESQELLTAEF